MLCLSYVCFGSCFILLPFLEVFRTTAQDCGWFYSKKEILFPLPNSWTNKTGMRRHGEDAMDHGSSNVWSFMPDSFKKNAKASSFLMFLMKTLIEQASALVKGLHQ